MSKNPGGQAAGGTSNPSSSRDDVTKSIDLVRSAQQGDAAALNRLFERYYDRVRRIVRMRLGPGLRSQVDTSDILQDTFTVAIGGFDKFEMRDEASLINWLAKLAERQILAAADFYRAKKRDRRREVRISTPPSVADSGYVSCQLAASVDAPLEQLSRGEQEALVESCIAELAPEYRELIILRDYAGASWESIAEQTGRPSASAARMMHSRALIELGRGLRTRGLP
jgi:RNA polymerase sigma-70 factor (ECF subfamily)